MTSSGNLHAGATSMYNIYHCGRMIDSGLAFCYDRATNIVPRKMEAHHGFQTEALC